MDTNFNPVPDSMILHDPITGEPMQQQCNINHIVLDPMTEQQLANQEHMQQMQQMQQMQNAQQMQQMNDWQRYNQQQYYNMQQEQTRRTDSKCTIMCTLSLLGFAIARAGNMMFFGMSSSTEIFDMLRISSFLWMCGVAGFITMIVARVKYPRSVYAKVVMWIYIASIIIKVIVFIAGFAMVMYFIKEIFGGF